MHERDAARRGESETLVGRWPHDAARDLRRGQQKRKLIEEAFGWAKTTAGLAKVKAGGLPRVRFQFTFRWPPTI